MVIWYHDCVIQDAEEDWSAIAISKEQLELYLEYGFTAVKITQLFSVSVKTIFRRLDKWEIQRKKYCDLSDMELDSVM